MNILTDVLQIPTLYDALYVSTSHISFLLVLPIMALAILHENVLQIEGRGNYTGFFVRLGLILGLLVIYKSFFSAVTNCADLLSKAIMPDNEFTQVIHTMFTQVKKNMDFGIFNLFKSALLNSVTYVTYLSTYIAYTVLIWLRFMLLSLLYIAGPILIAFGIYHKTSGPLASWMKSLFQVSFWTVTLSLLVRIISYMNLLAIYNLDHVNTISVVTANVLFILMFAFTPSITSALITEGHIGAIGAAAVGIAASSSYAFIKKISYSKLNDNQKNRQDLENQSKKDER
jgi:hypothetical protein